MNDRAGENLSVENKQWVSRPRHGHVWSHQSQSQPPIPPRQTLSFHTKESDQKCAASPINNCVRSIFIHSIFCSVLIAWIESMPAFEVAAFTLGQQQFIYSSMPLPDILINANTKHSHQSIINRSFCAFTRENLTYAMNRCNSTPSCNQGSYNSSNYESR